MATLNGLYKWTHFTQTEAQHHFHQTYCTVGFPRAYTGDISPTNAEGFAGKNCRKLSQQTTVIHTRQPNKYVTFERNSYMLYYTCCGFEERHQNNTCWGVRELCHPLLIVNTTIRCSQMCDFTPYIQHGF